MTEPGQEIELAAKAAGEIVGALAEESGALEPVREYATYIAAGIYYRHYPKLVDRALGAAEKIRRSGLPRRAFSEIPDPLLRAILEHGAEEDEPTMQERWESLLANALTEGSTEIKRAFPEVLAQLEPAEAAQLEKYADETDPAALQTTSFPVNDADIGLAGLDNLVRVNVLEYGRTAPTTLGSIGIDRASIGTVTFTDFGWAFVQACRAPGP